MNVLSKDASRSLADDRIHRHFDRGSATGATSSIELNFVYLQKAPARNDPQLFSRHRDFFANRLLIDDTVDDPSGAHLRAIDVKRHGPTFRKFIHDPLLRFDHDGIFSKCGVVVLARNVGYPRLTDGEVTRPGREVMARGRGFRGDATDLSAHINSRLWIRIAVRKDTGEKINVSRRRERSN